MRRLVHAVTLLSFLAGTAAAEDPMPPEVVHTEKAEPREAKGAPMEARAEKSDAKPEPAREAKAEPKPEKATPAREAKAEPKPEKSEPRTAEHKAEAKSERVAKSDGPKAKKKRAKKKKAARKSRHKKAKKTKKKAASAE